MLFERLNPENVIKFREKRDENILEKQHVYIIGSKGIPAKYGGFETFVENLTKYQMNQKIQYHVACMMDNSEKSGITDKHFIQNGADCYNINVPDIGPVKAIYYDIAAINYAIDLAEKKGDFEPIFYVLACRIGPFMKHIHKRIKKINGKLLLNPDGHEWLRSKWSYPVRKYWKISEQLMVKYADLLICDSRNIQEYICKDYEKYDPATKYIPYGTNVEPSILSNKNLEVVDWYYKKSVKENEYYLIVGRFVPENNFETMIEEFMKSNSKKDLVIITNVTENKFFKKLVNKTNFKEDSRIKFVGTVYNQQLLCYIRKNAYAYLHGHEVGGTNPSLLEALSNTKFNLLFDIGFNREVAEDTALYWTKKEGSLSNLIESLENNENVKLKNSKELMRANFSWGSIVEKYEESLIKSYE